jgi:hypothetical protein
MAENHRSPNEYFGFPRTRDRTKVIEIYLSLTLIDLNKVVKIAKAAGNVEALKGEG